MKAPRLRPSYKVFAVGADGARELLDARTLVVELRPGVEVEIDLAPHPNFAGELVLLTPSVRRMKCVYGEGKVDSFAVVFGAENVLHVRVERRIRRRRRQAP